MLSDNEFKERVKRLEGQIIYTYIQKRPNKIINVTNDKVIIAGRKSHISFYGEYGLLANYRVFHKDRKLVISDKYLFLTIELARGYDRRSTVGKATAKRRSGRFAGYIS